MKTYTRTLIVFTAIVALCLIVNFALAEDSLYIDPSGNVGIGTTSPSEELSVSGDGYITGTLGLNGALVDANRGINFSSIDAGATAYGMYNVMDTNNFQVSGVYNELTSDTAYDGAAGMRNSLFATSTNGMAYGIDNTITLGGDDTYGYGHSLWIQTTDDGYTQSARGLYMVAETHSNDEFIGVRAVDFMGESTGGTQYGLYVNLDDPDVTNFSVYVEPGSGISYFGSNVGIGVTNPVQKLQVEGIIAPGMDGIYDLGSSTLHWKDIYASNGTIQTSDERRKENIREISLGLDFIDQLRPIAYDWKDYHVPEVKETKTIEHQKTRRVTKEVNENVVELVNGKYVQKRSTKTIEAEEPVFEEHPLYDENGSLVGMHKIPVMETVDEEVTVQKERNETFYRTHYGLSAQQVKGTLDSFGVDFDGIVYDQENDTYGIRMGEFVPILMKAVQELKAEVDLLKAEISQLKK